MHTYLTNWYKCMCNLLSCYICNLYQIKAATVTYTLICWLSAAAHYNDGLQLMLPNASHCGICSVWTIQWCVTHGNLKLAIDCHFNLLNHIIKRATVVITGFTAIYRGPFEMVADRAHVTIDSQVYVGTVLHFTLGFLMLGTNKIPRE